MEHEVKILHWCHYSEILNHPLLHTHSPKNFAFPTWKLTSQWNSHPGISLLQTHLLIRRFRSKNKHFFAWKRERIFDIFFQVFSCISLLPVYLILCGATVLPRWRWSCAGSPIGIYSVGVWCWHFLNIFCHFKIGVHPCVTIFAFLTAICPSANKISFTSGGGQCLADCISLKKWW